jgi:hypothetical protein
MSNCGCCCTNTLNFCAQNVCGDIDFDVKAQATGTHKMVTGFMGMQIIIENEITAGDNIAFPIDSLNENFQYTVELFDPNGSKILIRKNDIDYDCFKFKTYINVTISNAV